MVTLRARGEADRIAPVAHGERWRDALPDARLEVVADAGHCAGLEQPDRVAELTLAFFR